MASPCMAVPIYRETGRGDGLSTKPQPNNHLLRRPLSVLFSEPGGRDVQDFSVFGDCSSGDVADFRFGEFVSDFIVVERLGFVLFVDDLLELGLDGIPGVLSAVGGFHSAVEQAS